MNNALKKDSNNENELPKQTAVVISIEKVTAKRSRKKNITEAKEKGNDIQAPGFTSPVFKPRKHDLF